MVPLFGSLKHTIFPTAATKTLIKATMFSTVRIAARRGILRGGTVAVSSAHMPQQIFIGFRTQSTGFRTQFELQHKSVRYGSTSAQGMWDSIKGMFGLSSGSGNSVGDVAGKASDAVSQAAEPITSPSGQTVAERVAEKASETAANVADGAKEAVGSVDPSSAANSIPFDTTLGFDTPDAVQAATDAASQISTSLTPDQLGYLHSVGLVDGWWPSDMFQEALELVHVFTGMPWWVTISVTTIVIRVLIFPLFVRSSDTTAKSQKIMPLTNKIRGEISQATRRGDQRMQQIKTFQLKELNKRYGIRYRDMFISPVVQMAFAMGAFFGVREMANLPIDTFNTGGALWFADLTAADPYVGLQIISACLYAGSFLLGGETAMSQTSATMKKVFVVLPFASILFTWNLSAGVMVYLTANGVCSVIQSRLLRSPGFRKWAKIAPLTAKNQTNPFAANPGEKKKGMFDKMTQGWDDMKNNSKVRVEMQEKADQATKLLKKRAQSSRVIIKGRK